jgi:hypothetical protein
LTIWTLLSIFLILFKNDVSDTGLSSLSCKNLLGPEIDASSVDYAQLGRPLLEDGDIPVSETSFLIKKTRTMDNVQKPTLAPNALFAAVTTGNF